MKINISDDDNINYPDVILKNSGEVVTIICDNCSGDKKYLVQNKNKELFYISDSEIKYQEVDLNSKTLIIHFINYNFSDDEILVIEYSSYSLIIKYLGIMNSEILKYSTIIKFIEKNSEIIAEKWFIDELTFDKIIKIRRATPEEENLYYEY